MARRGVKRISGPASPRIGQPAAYTVAEWHPETPDAMKANVKWQLFKRRSSGQYESISAIKNGSVGSFTFTERSLNEDLLVEGYLFNPELSGPTTVNVRPTQGEPNILTITILDYQGNRFSSTPQYGQTVTITIETVNMIGEDLTISLWERDTISDEGHDTDSNTKLWETQATIENTNGTVSVQKQLTLDMAVNADKGIFEGGTHEYYVLVRSNRSNQYNISEQQLEVSGDTSGYAVVSALQTALQVAGITNDPAPENGNSPSVVGEEATREETTPGYWNIFVSSKADRVNNPFGVGVLVDDNGVEIFKFQLRLQGAGGADRTRQNSDTPLGAYGLGHGASRNDYHLNSNQSVYGPYRRMVMSEASPYTSGEIVDDTTRKYIRIHGGRQSPTSRYGHYPLLRKTHGCIRAFDTNMNTLNQRIQELMSSEGKNLYPGHVVVSNDLVSAIFKHTATVQDPDGSTNMRSNYTSDSNIVSAVNNGTQVEILNYSSGTSSLNGRFKVRLQNGREGYIYNTKLSNFSHQVMSYSVDSSKTVIIENPKPER
ncbi:hypothetical protein [Lacinutrix chionoecetis]